MTSISTHILEIRHDRIDPVIMHAIRAVDAIARSEGVRYVLAGATARELLLRHVFGRPPGRRTLDVDFAIAVRDWEQFREIKNALVLSNGFEADPKQIQRVRCRGSEIVLVDLIPFGGVETVEGLIAWPPDGEIVMHVAGFDDALKSAVHVRLEGELILPVVCVPVLIILKLFAWLDRRQYNSKDADDIFTILVEYGEAGNEERLFGAESALLEEEGFNFEMAGARLAGKDAAKIVSGGTRERAREVLISDQHVRQLVDQIVAARGGIEGEQSLRCESLLLKFRLEFLDASSS